jgi:PAS domain S-box-containing protein
MSNNGSKTALNEEILKTILDNSYDEIFVLDGKDYVIYVNNVCKRHYGLMAAEMIGKTVYELDGMGYWQPTLIPIVRKEKRSITLEQTTYLGQKLLTTVTPVLDPNGEIVLSIYNVRDLTQLDTIRQELEHSRQALAADGHNKPEEKSCEIIVRNKKMRALMEFVEQVAQVDSSVLLLGESGTGKGLFAEHIHSTSPRNKGPFLVINCAAIPEELLESELFGYSRGAFTGANSKGKRGLFELADKGTLFLDEIADLSLRLQAKILQAIQYQQFIPVGGTEIKNVDVRILSATNSNLQELAQSGKFRKDLYFRLNIVEITIPPLRERPDEIMPLTYYYLRKFNSKYSVCRDISSECFQVLCEYSWPGNVRELANLIERLVVTVREPEIKPHHLTNLHNWTVQASQDGPPKFPDHFTSDFSFESFLEKVEKYLVTTAFEKFGSSRKVAKAMRLSETKAARLIRKYC